MSLTNLVRNEAKKKSFLGRALYTVGCVFLSAYIGFFSSACKSSSNGGDGDDKTKVKIEATTNLIETFTKGPVSGQITYEYGGNSKTVSTGEKALIAEVYQDSLPIRVKITAEADDHVKRIIKQEPMMGTHDYTIDVKDKTGFDWDGFVNTMIPSYNYNILKRLRPPTNGRLTMYFNPDYAGTGQRLPQSWIDETINQWEWIKNNSNGKITDITYIRDGNKQVGDLPQEGEVYVFEDTSTTGAWNGTFTRSDGSVYGIILGFRSSTGAIGFVCEESRDSLVDGEQNGLIDKDDWIRFLWYRIAGDNNGSKIFSDHEEQDVVDDYCGIASFLYQRVINSPFGSSDSPRRFFDIVHPDDYVTETLKHPSRSEEKRLTKESGKSGEKKDEKISK